jgi:hypothetical protein
LELVIGGTELAKIAKRAILGCKIGGGERVALIGIRQWHSIPSFPPLSPTCGCANFGGICLGIPECHLAIWTSKGSHWKNVEEY